VGTGIQATISAMDMNEYQQAALRTTRGHDQPNELAHLTLGLVGEAGEIAEKIKKYFRGDIETLAQLDRADIAKELGDVLWYLAVLADHLGIPLDDIASGNIKKLASRQKRGLLHGDGDNR
jgi:NTP pyrophosphatase (non-canonical NTP hydrolase)